MCCKPIPACIRRHDHNQTSTDQQSYGDAAIIFRLRKYEIGLAGCPTTRLPVETRNEFLCIKLHGVCICPQKPHGVSNPWKRFDVISLQRDQ
ncbi:hypothetical protein AA103581_2315 [Gluconobacter wancherniae NBRC 103581]|nr:hypothetical protein AA103581_2315 [Gluconobacter wancherniae NBRC 103581]